MVAAMGLVVDGGMAWGQQRDNQNAADAVSEAGAVVLAERLSGDNRVDGDVLAAVDGSVTANGVVKDGAWYTDILGNLLDGAGGIVGSTAAAAPVGGGSIPANAYGVQAAHLEDVRHLPHAGDRSADADHAWPMPPPWPATSKACAHRPPIARFSRSRFRSMS